MRTKFRIVKTRRKAAICITSKSPRLQKLDVKMHFDHGKARVLDRKRFEYVADPTIELAYSGTCTVYGVVYAYGPLGLYHVLYYVLRI